MKSLLSYRLFALGSLLALGLRFLANVFLARSGGVAEFGIYLSILIIPLMAIRLTDLSVQQALGFYVRRDERLFAKGAVVIVGHSLLAAPFLFALAYSQRWLPADSPIVLAAAGRLWLPIGGIMVASAISSGLVSLFIALEAFVAYALVAAISPGGLLLGALFLAHSNSATAATIVDVMLTVEIIAALCAITFAAYLARGRAVRGGVTLRELYGYGLRAHPGVVTKVIGARLDRLLLVALLPPAALAVYSVAVNVRDILVQPMSMYSVVFTNRLISKVGSVSEAVKYLKRTLGVASIGIGAALLIGIPLAPWLFSIFYGAAYSKAVPIFRIIAPTVLFIADTGLLWSLFYALKRPGLVSKSILISTLPGFGLLYLMAAWDGPVGAAWAVLITQAAGFFAAGFVAIRLLRDVQTSKAAS